MNVRRTGVLCASLMLALSWCHQALAQAPESSEVAAPTVVEEAPAAPEPAPAAAAAEPAPAPAPEAATKDRGQGKKPAAYFRLDPVTDSVVMVGAATLAGFTQVVITSGVLGAPFPGDPAQLPSIDRKAAENALEIGEFEGATADATLIVSGVMTLGVATATWLREDDIGSGLTDLGIFVEVALVNAALGNSLKLAIRRPRPKAYVYWQENVLNEDGSINEEALLEYQKSTELGLSFPSLHTSTVASLWGAASYMAFARNWNPWEKWVTVGAGGLATALVATERISTLSHFPTDVIAGALLGASTGVLIPHLHRVEAPISVTPEISGEYQGVSVFGVW